MKYEKHTEKDFYCSSASNGMIVALVYVAYSTGYIFYFADANYSRTLQSSGNAISVSVDGQGVLHVTNNSLILYWITLFCAYKMKTSYVWPPTN